MASAAPRTNIGVTMPAIIHASTRGGQGAGSRRSRFLASRPCRVTLGPVDPSRRFEGSLRWLVRLGWIAVAGQAATVAVVRFVLGVALPVSELAGVIAAAAALNLAVAALARRKLGDVEGIVGAVLVLQTLLLTAMLWLTGGPSNPFGVLYLVHVTIAAIASRPRWTWSVVAVSIGCYGALFVSHRPIPDALGGHGHMHAAAGHDHGDAFSIHLQGMFVAFALAACLIAWFVGRVTRALAEERERSARAARLVGLTTLAAGAAHELATPLATIKVAATELQRVLALRTDLGDALEDARLVRREVARSREVLDRLSVRAGEDAGEPTEHVTVAALISDVLHALEGRRERVDVRSCEGNIAVPRRALYRTVANLVENALDASPREDRVELSVELDAQHARFSVRDRGEGMSAATLARIGEPFFTTKPTGRGMGLGVFLARSLAEQLGGKLEHRSHPGRGTTAILSVPRSAP